MNETYSHKLLGLVATAGLLYVMVASQKLNVRFATHWGVVNLWKPESRYATASPQEASELITAIEDNKDGVLPWIKQHW